MKLVIWVVGWILVGYAIGIGFQRLIPVASDSAGRVMIAEYKPGSSRIVAVSPEWGSRRTLTFENGKCLVIDKYEDITFLVKPGEIVLRAPNGSYQLRVDYLEDKQDELEGLQR